MRSKAYYKSGNWLTGTLFGLLLCFLATPLTAEAIAMGEARRGFKGPIGREMATLAATCDARLGAMEQAVRELAAREEVRLFLSSDTMRDAPRPDPLALAWALVESENINSQVDGIPPDMQVIVNLGVMLSSGKSGQELFRQLLRKQELMQVYTGGIGLLRESLAAYDGAAVIFLIPGISTEKSRDTSIEKTKLLDAGRRLEASANFLELLPQLYPLSEESALPEASAFLLKSMEEISARHQDNYLILTELARVRLLSGHIPSARADLDKAISLKPDYALAYSRRGMVMLWLELPTLALKDFDKAISLEPYHPVFYENRALAHRVLEHKDAMCQDLAESCKLGECGGLNWAAGEGICQVTPSSVKYKSDSRI